MSNKNIGIIVQARTGSTRLPGKILLPIDEEGTTFLDLLLSRLKLELGHIPIVVATSINPKDDIIVERGRIHDISTFRGSEEDVLDRFTSCAAHFGFDTIVRICSDNPFLDLDALQTLINSHTSEDYLSHQINGRPSILTHYGFFAEIVSLSALKKASSMGSTCREHVTNCIYRNPESFRVRFEALEISNEAVRCTLDTPGDFEALTLIYKHWYLQRTDSRCPYLDLIAYIEDHDELIQGMQNQIIVNSK